MARLLTVKVGKIGLAILIALLIGQMAWASFVTDNLILHLDASNVDGAGAPATGTPGDNYGWADLSGNYRNGTLAWNGWDVAGVGDGSVAAPYAMRLDGIDDYVDFVFMDIDETSLSYEVWIKTDETIGNYGALFGEYPDAGYGTRAMMQVTNASWNDEAGTFDSYPAAADDGKHTAPGSCPVGEWLQFVVTRDGNQLSMYVNGSLVSADFGGNPFPVTMTELYDPTDYGDVTKTWLGARAVNGAVHNPYLGDIGLVRIYGDALTTQEVAGNFDNDKATFGLDDGPEEIPGDANRDGYVDVSDLGILATHYGTVGGATWDEADFTSDGNVDVSDLGILATNYGTEPGSQVVPEPASALLLAGATLLLLRRRRQGY